MSKENPTAKDLLDVLDKYLANRKGYVNGLNNPDITLSLNSLDSDMVDVSHMGTLWAVIHEDMFDGDVQDRLRAGEKIKAFLLVEEED